MSIDDNVLCVISWYRRNDATEMLMPVRPAFLYSVRDFSVRLAPFVVSRVLLDNLLPIEMYLERFDRRVDSPPIMVQYSKDLAGYSARIEERSMAERI